MRQEEIDAAKAGIDVDDLFPFGKPKDEDKYAVLELGGKLYRVPVRTFPVPAKQGESNESR